MDSEISMTEKVENKYSVNELVQYQYSDIGEYIDENHTPKPLRNDELVKILNNYDNKLSKILHIIHNEKEKSKAIYNINRILNGDDII